MLIRLGTTAGVALALAGAAAAQEWSLDLGGQMKAGLGYVDAELHTSELELVNDAEVVANFALTADNGLRFGAKVEFEASGTSENADEYVAWVTGAFGRIEIGREDGAADRLLLTPPGCSYSCAASGDGFLFDWARDAAGPLIDNDLDAFDSGDTLKITYFSPKFSGFQVGASYVPGSDKPPSGGGTSTNGLDDSAQAVELGARWDIDIGGMMGDPDAELSLSGVYADVGGTGFDDESFAVAAEIDAYGVGFGARYANAADGFEESVSVGIDYATGPWFFGALGNFTLDSERRDDDMAASLEVNYALAPGVTLAGVLEFADYSFTDPADPRDGGTAAGVLMVLDF